MTHDNEEPSAASAGSVVAVAWAAVWPEDGDGVDCGWIYPSEEDAIHAATACDGIDGRRGVGTVVPLYFAPTLTDAEREAVIHAMAALDHVGTDWTLQCATTLRGLLERTK